MSAAVFTNAGRGLATARLAGSGTAPTYLGWGHGAVDLHDATASDTALFQAAAEARVSGTCTAQTQNTAFDTWQLVGTLTTATDQTIGEVGAFDASSAGTCTLHATFGAIPLLAGDQVTFTCRMTFT